MKRKNSAFLIRILASTCKQNPWTAFLLLISLIGTVIAGILPPLVLERVVNLLTEGIGNEILWLAIAYFALTSAEGIFDSLKEAMIALLGQKITHSIRSQMIAKLNRLPASYFVKTDPGTTTSRIVNDVNTLETLFSSGIISIIVDACKVISVVAVVFIKSKGLGLLLILALPFLFAMTKHFKTKTFEAQLDSRKAVGSANRIIHETIENLRMVRIFHCEKFIEGRYDNAIKDGFEAVEKSNFYDAIFTPVVVIVRIVITSIMMCLSAAGGTLRLFFGMSAATAVAVVAYVEKIFDPLANIGKEITNIQTASAGVSRICEFMEEAEMTNEQNDVLSKGASVEISNLSFAYDLDTPVLRNLSLKVESGEMVTLTGRTGCGKSTLFKLLMGLYSPQSGEILVAGQKPTSISNTEKRKLFGYVEQSFKAVPGTIFDQISLRENDVTKEDALKAIRLVGLEDLVLNFQDGLETKFETTLFSQGQLQLLSIARAIVKNPRILLLDEITANLDSSTEKQVLLVLNEATKGRTTISISHRLYEQNKGRIISLPEAALRAQVYK